MSWMREAETRDAGSSREAAADEAKGYTMQTTVEQSPAWQISAERYLYERGVHSPQICEISPMQRGLMGKQAGARYDKRRREGWAVAAAAAAEWKREVIAAFDAGEISLDTTALHREAREAIRLELGARAEAAREAERRKVYSDNAAVEISALRPGDRLWFLMWQRYVTVRKVNKITVTVETEDGRRLSREPHHFLLRSHADSRQ
jgi:hypothetical protein